MVAGAGFDWMLIDGEHAPHDLRSILDQLQATAAHDTPVLVRAETGDTVLIKRLLDLGVLTLLVPMVESADQAHRDRRRRRAIRPPGCAAWRRR